jgi:general secretion pathway protein K
MKTSFPDLSPSTRNPAGGFALIIVMVVIAILGGIAVHFASNMKVELKLAQNANFDADFEVLGLSGIEYARYVLALEAATTMTTEPFDALHQVWAGGTGSENYPMDEELMMVNLNNNQLGSGSFSISITDMERKWNINSANEAILEQCLILLGVDLSEMSAISNSILDWMDPDQIVRPGGAETDDYLAMNPPYLCKDGPLDDITELLRVRGITPPMFWGPEFNPSIHLGPGQDAEMMLFESQALAYPYGLKDFFTPISSGTINVNTAPTQVLMMIPGIDELAASEIVAQRSGPDGIQGTPDDTPYASPSMLPILPDVLNLASRFLSVRSLHFLVEVDVTINSTTRRFEALIRRESPTRVDTIFVRRR